MRSVGVIKKANFYANQGKEVLPASETITIFTPEEIEKFKADVDAQKGSAEAIPKVFEEFKNKLKRAEGGVERRVTPAKNEEETTETTVTTTTETTSSSSSTTSSSETAATAETEKKKTE